MTGLETLERLAQFAETFDGSICIRPLGAVIILTARNNRMMLDFSIDRTKFNHWNAAFEAILLEEFESRVRNAFKLDRIMKQGNPNANRNPGG